MNKQTKTIGLISLLIVGGLFGIFIFKSEDTNASGSTLYVGGIGPGNYSSIQSAIDNASSGDLIKVYSGIYFENIIVNKSITLIGNGTANTTIDGGGNGDVVYVNANWVNISGFKINNSRYPGAGVFLDNVQNCKIESNLLGDNNTKGIILNSSMNNTITNNICNVNYDDGIYLKNSSNNTITNNTCKNNYNNGIRLTYSFKNILINNTCLDNLDYGIHLQHSLNNVLVHNTMINDGINIEGDQIEHWNTHKINTSNKVNGNPIYYWKNATSGKLPSDAGQVILANCTNIIVEALNISNSGVGILLGHSSKIYIANNTCNYDHDGISLSDSSNNTIFNNSGSNNHYPILLTNSAINKITNNTFVLNSFGIQIEDSNNNTIFNNNFSNNLIGLRLMFSINNNIVNNSFRNSDTGIVIYESSNITLKNNNCSNANDYGIEVVDSSYNLIANNICLNNIGDGIRLWQSFKNKIENSTCSKTKVGIMVWYSPNNTLMNNTCNSNIYGISIISSSGTMINNCSMTSNSFCDFYLTQGSKNMVAINTSFSTIIIDPSSTLALKNYLHIQVNDSNGLPLQNADVQVKDNDEVIYATSEFGGNNKKTNTLGQIKWILVTDRIFVSGAPICNITKVNVDYSELFFIANNRTIDMYRSHFEYFYPNFEPSKPILIRPLNNTYLSDPKPELKWNASTDKENDPLTYFIQIDEFGEDWSSPIYTAQTAPNILKWNVTANLINGHYQWHISAYDGLENGAWSDTWKFSLDSDIPNANIPIAPGLYYNSSTVNWSWSPSIDPGSGILGYFVSIGTAPGGNDVLYDAWTNDAWFELAGLENGKTYYCKVKAKNGVGTIGIYSENSEGITIDLTPPTDSSISINRDDEYTNSSSVLLLLDAVDTISGLKHMRFSLDNLFWGDWKFFNYSKDYMLPTSDGLKTIYFQVKDQAGNIATAVSDSIALDTLPPHSLSITINEGAEETSITSVILTLNGIDDGSGIDKMQFSIDGNTWDDWQPFNTTEYFTLSSGDGFKTIYFRVKDCVGHITNPVFDTIILNKIQPPIDSDGDGFPDDIDEFPDDPSEWIDTDNDGHGDNSDKFPDDPNEYMDSDSDLIGDFTDLDDDNDLMPDVWELLYGFNTTNTSNAYMDPDNDNLTNIEEFLHNTNPLNSDTDEDGLSDGEEILIYGTNATNPDTDGDGFDDGYEIEIGTDPLDENDYPRTKKKDSKGNSYEQYILPIVITAIVVLTFVFIFIIKKKQLKKSEIHDEKQLYEE